jgi:uncharacterized protein (TIGR03435 family)
MNFYEEHSRPIIMSKPKTIVLVTVLIAVLVAAVVVKLVFFPSVKDAWFAMNQGNLQRVPLGLVILRPTHFPNSTIRRGVMYAPSQKDFRVMGRNVSLRGVMATAYGESTGRVLLPPGAPTNNFDFLVTLVAEKPLERLQKAIHNKLGYTAQKQTIDTDVLALKVENPNSPGLTVSAPDEKENGNFKNGKLYLTHFPLKELTGGFEQILKTPVVDETGLTNYYDFSLTWNPRFLASLRSETTARPTLDKLLAGWGLGLEPDTASVEMLVVKKD